MEAEAGNINLPMEVFDNNKASGGLLLYLGCE